MAANMAASMVIGVSAEDANYTTLTLCGDASASVGRDMLDITSYGATAGAVLAGLKRWRPKLKCFYDDTNAGADIIRTAHGAGSTLYVQILLDGTNGYKGATLVSTIDIGGAVNGVATMDVTLQENGAWSEV
jgi:predicted secreted protein